MNSKYTSSFAILKDIGTIVDDNPSVEGPAKSGFALDAIGFVGKSQEHTLCGWARRKLFAYAERASKVEANALNTCSALCAVLGNKRAQPGDEALCYSVLPNSHVVRRVCVSLLTSVKDVMEVNTNSAVYELLETFEAFRQRFLWRGRDQVDGCCSWGWFH